MNNITFPVSASRTITLTARATAAGSAPAVWTGAFDPKDPKLNRIGHMKVTASTRDNGPKTARRVDLKIEAPILDAGTEATPVFTNKAIINVTCVLPAAVSDLFATDLSLAISAILGSATVKAAIAEGYIS